MDLGFTDVWGGEADARIGLRPLGWSELCARLAAAQDLRRLVQAGSGAVAPPGGAGAASFHRPAAQMLLDAAFMGLADGGERAVNLDGSEFGKADSGTIRAVHEERRASSADCPSRRENP